MAETSGLSFLPPLMRSVDNDLHSLARLNYQFNSLQLGASSADVGSSWRDAIGLSLMSDALYLTKNKDVRVLMLTDKEGLEGTDVVLDASCSAGPFPAFSGAVLQRSNI